MGNSAYFLICSVFYLCFQYVQKIVHCVFFRVLIFCLESRQLAVISHFVNSFTVDFKNQEYNIPSSWVLFTVFFINNITGTFIMKLFILQRHFLLNASQSMTNSETFWHFVINDDLRSSSHPPMFKIIFRRSIATLESCCSSIFCTTWKNLLKSLSLPWQNQHNHNLSRTNADSSITRNRKSSISISNIPSDQNYITQNGLRDAFVLDLGRVFETAVHNRALELRFQEKITETWGVDADVVTLLGVGGGGLSRACDFILEVRESVVFVSGHFGECFCFRNIFLKLIAFCSYYSRIDLNLRVFGLRLGRENYLWIFICCSKNRGKKSKIWKSTKNIAQKLLSE